MNFFDHKNLGNHLLQLCPEVVKHPVLFNNILPIKTWPKLCFGINWIIYVLLQTDHHSCQKQISQILLLHPVRCYTSWMWTFQASNCMLHIFHTIIILYIFNFVYAADMLYSNLLHTAHLFKICGTYTQILFMAYIMNHISIIKNINFVSIWFQKSTLLDLCFNCYIIKIHLHWRWPHRYSSLAAINISTISTHSAICTYLQF